MPSQRHSGSLIKKISHLPGVSGRRKTLFGALQNRADLFSGNPREPVEEILDTCATLKILKQSSNRNAGAFENPSAGYLFR